MTRPAVAPSVARTGTGRLSAVVFVAGIGALSVEICASRLLAPFFGNSTIVWANIIGLILVYLSLGYWLGGRVADKHSRPRVLGWLIMAAAICVAVLPFITKPLFTVALHAFDDVSTGAAIASFFSTLLLFALPVTLLGMVSPFAIRLAIDDVSKAGALSGRLYALSTMGSILGTFIPALITIPLIGTQRTMIGAAVLLGLAATILLGRTAAAVTLALGLLMVIPPGVVKEQSGLIAEAESPYQYVQVVQQKSGERDLYLNEGIAIHSVWRPSSYLTGGEWDMFLVAPALLGRAAKRILIIGNAGGTTARALGHYYPGAQVDAVEIDPTVTDVGRRYFGLGDNRDVNVHTEDGRVFLELTDQKYDLIMVDAYRQPYIPFYLATQEFFQLSRDHLTQGGALALNVERVPGDDTLSHTIESTVASVMPDAWTWPALKFNELLVSFNQSSKAIPALRRSMAGDIAILGSLFTEQVIPADHSQPPMTDDHAPIEWITDKSLLHYIAGGGKLIQPGLPDG